MVTTLLHLMVILSLLLHCLGFSYDKASSHGPSRWGSFEEMITSCKTGSQQSPVMIRAKTAQRIQIADLSYVRPRRIMGVFGNNGPSRWGSFEEMITSCKTGSQQSPVMIRAKTAQRIQIADLSYVRPRRIMGVFGNNGHSPQFVPDTRPNNELVLRNVPDLVTSDFVFCDLHFHIGGSSRNGPEHVLSNHINVSGEIHLVHWKRDDNTTTLSAALRDPNGLTVVALFFKVIEECQGEADRIIQQYVSRIRDVDETKDGYIDPALLYPNRRYYTYRGSLTTPPCSEIVRWILLETPITICRKSLHILQIMETDEEGSVALSVFGNVRPVQRKVVASLKRNF